MGAPGVFDTQTHARHCAQRHSLPGWTSATGDDSCGGRWGNGGGEAARLHESEDTPQGTDPLCLANAHPIESIEVAPWPLALAWGQGGRIDVTQAQWESLSGSWFVDEDGRTGHVRRYCTGGTDGCTTFTIEVSLLQRVASPLSDDQHRHLLTFMPWGFAGFGLPLEGPDFDAVAHAQVLDVPDPDDHDVQHVLTVVARPEAVLDVAL